MKKTLALLLLLTCLPRASAEVKIEGDLKVSPPKYMAVLKARSTETGTSFLWRITDKRLHVLKRGDEVILAGPPGSYDITLIGGTIKGGALLLEEAEATVVIGPGDEPPKPQPEPGPGPNPTPGPVSGKLWLVVVEETADARAERGRWLRDEALHGYVAKKGWKIRLTDKDAKDASGNVPADLKPYIDRARGKELPQAYVVDEKGKVHHEGVLPAEAADLLKLLKKLVNE